MQSINKPTILKPNERALNVQEEQINIKSDGLSRSIQRDSPFITYKYCIENIC